MFKKLAQFYKSRNRRERIMLACVVAGIFLVWLTMLSSKNSEVSSEIQRLNSRKAIAETAIARAPEIQAELEKIRKVFDSSKSVSAVNLQIAVEKCATEAELTYSLSSAETKDAGKFKIHTITLSSQKSDLKQYSKFEEKIAELEPYVTLARVLFDGDGKGGVTAKYTINSFELAQ